LAFQGRYCCLPFVAVSGSDFLSSDQPLHDDIVDVFEGFAPLCMADAVRLCAFVTLALPMRVGRRTMLQRLRKAARTGEPKPPAPTLHRSGAHAKPFGYD